MREENSDRQWPWLDQPQVMGIINASPDSFFSESVYAAEEKATRQATKMIAQGATIIDLGAEGSSPEAETIDTQAEIDRLVPYVETISELDTLVSVDTYKPPVAESTLEAGADLINDPSGLDDHSMADVVSDHDAGLVINHCIEPIVTNENYNFEYDDVVAEVKEYLREKAEIAEKAGVDSRDIVVDPGFGFQKSAKYNVELLRRFEELTEIGYPVLSGPSRKPVFTKDIATDDFLSLTLGITSITVQKGADIVRVHDVEENADALTAGHLSRIDVRSRSNIPDR